MPTLTLIPKKAVLNLQAGDPGSFTKSLSFWTIIKSDGSREPQKKELAFEPTFTEQLVYSVTLERDILRFVRLTSGEDLKTGRPCLAEETVGDNTDKAVGLLDYVPDFDLETA